LRQSCGNRSRDGLGFNAHPKKQQIPFGSAQGRLSRDGAARRNDKVKGWALTFFVNPFAAASQELWRMCSENEDRDP
jgi:hypothetical protein